MRPLETIRRYSVKPRNGGEKLAEDLFGALGQSFYIKEPEQPYQRLEDGSFLGTVIKFDNPYEVKISSDGTRVEIRHGQLPQPKCETIDIEEIETILQDVLEG